MTRQRVIGFVRVVTYAVLLAAFASSFAQDYDPRDYVDEGTDIYDSPMVGGFDYVNQDYSDSEALPGGNYPLIEFLFPPYPLGTRGIYELEIGQSIRDIWKTPEKRRYQLLRTSHRPHHSLVFIENYRHDPPFGGGGARVRYDEDEKVTEIEMHVDTLRSLASKTVIPPDVGKVLGEVEETGRIGSCLFAKTPHSSTPGDPAAIFVRSFETPPLGLGFRRGESWLRIGTSEFPRWASSCTNEYAVLGYELGMRLDDAQAMWMPIDGRKRRVEKIRHSLRVRSSDRHPTRRWVDATLHFDGERRLESIEVDRFSRHLNFSYFLARFTEIAHEMKTTRGRIRHIWRENRHLVEPLECPNYLDRFTERWGEPVARYDARRDREHAIWIDEEAGVAVAAEQTLRKGCTEISFTMRRIDSRPPGDAEALYERLRDRD